MHRSSLQRTLYANAGFSGICGFALLALPSWWASAVLQVPSAVFALLGAGLIAFAVLVSSQARMAEPRLGIVKWICVADLAWVIATPVVLLALSGRFTALGIWLMVDIALVVALFALLQYRGLRQRLVLGREV